MRTLVFKVPNRDLQALVTIYDDGRCTLAFRPGYGTWGPPIQSLTEQRGAVIKVAEPPTMSGVCACGGEVSWAPASQGKSDGMCSRCGTVFTLAVQLGDVRYEDDLDSGPRTLPDYMRGRG